MRPFREVTYIRRINGDKHPYIEIDFSLSKLPSFSKILCNWLTRDRRESDTVGIRADEAGKYHALP